MAESALIFRVPGAAWTLGFSIGVVKQLGSHAQRKWWSKESVGQLYSADVRTTAIEVQAVSKLPAVWSSFAGVGLDVKAVREERAKFFKEGLHCLGFWHSHPEPVPRPSPDDLEMAADHARAGNAVYTGLVFVIVGTAPPPHGLGVWVHDGTRLWAAEASSELHRQPFS